MQKLEADFKANGGEWKEFELKSLFSVERGTRYVKEKRKNGPLPLITAGEQNQGVAEFIQYDPELKLYENHITIDMFCNCFYRDYKFVCDDNILVLIPEKELSKNVSLFFVSSINKQGALFDYGKQYRQKSFSEHKIILPVQNNKPAFSYMEKFTRELEEERVRELAAYLKVSGLSDATLTESERSAFSKFTSGGGVIFKKFKIENLFTFVPAPYLKKSPRQDNVSRLKNKEFSLPLVCAKKGNNGIMYWGRSCDFIFHKNVLSVVYNGVVAAGLVYAQDESVGIFTDSYLIKMKDKEVSFLTNLFLKTVIEKTIYKKYSRELKATWSRVKENDILLPLNNLNEIDFEFMENFIRAIEKMTIKAVIEYKDKIICETQKNIF